MSQPPKGYTKMLVTLLVFFLVAGLLTALIVSKLGNESQPANRFDRGTTPDNTIRINLRQLSMGAEVYFTENAVSSVASVTIVGTNSSQYIMSFATVANETYTRIVLQNHAVTASGIAGARTITYGP